jgi:hypothetical protein
MLNIFEIMTLEGWSDVMYMVRQAEDTYVYDMLFVLCLGMGSFFVLNLMTAVQFAFFEKENPARKKAPPGDALSRTRTFKRQVTAFYQPRAID